MKSRQIRPYSSYPMRSQKNTTKENRVYSATNPYGNFTYRNLPSPHSRPKTSMQDINNMTLFKKSSKDAKLDVLNLIIETNPKKYNLDKIGTKIKEINPMFTEGSFYSLQRPKFSKNTKETYYKYNILYGSETNNIIRTYSPKMRPMSSSITSFRKNMVLTEDIDYPVFTEKEIENLAINKCKDIGIEVRNNMIYKFKELCKAKCKNRKVDFSQCNLGYYSCQILSRIILKDDRIAVLNLSNNNIGNKGAELLANAIKDTSSLVALNITSNSITHKGGNALLKALKIQQSIVDFNISSSEGTNRNRIGPNGLNQIEAILSFNLFLEKFYVAGNGIKNEGITKIFDGLNKNQTLHFLDISHNDINSIGIENSFPKLKICKLIELNISENKIGDEGLNLITDSLKNFPQIHVLKIANCGIEFKGFLYLCSHLVEMKRITTLDISGNDIKSNRFDQLKQYFVSFGIINLNISNCSLGDKSGSVFGECLCLNETIKKVKLSENKISDRGFRSFIPLFKTNNTIQNFDASKNFITDESAEGFIENMRLNHVLKHLNLYDNQLKNEMGNLFVEILSSNKTLLTINVGFNRVPIKVIDEINKKLKVNYEKLKSKFVPGLEKQIKDIQLNPEMFRFLAKKIKDSQTYQTYISQKLVEDEVMFKELRIKEEKDLEMVIKESDELEKEVEEHDLQLKQIINEIKKLKDDIKFKSSDITESIEKLREEVKIQKESNDKIKDECEEQLKSIKEELEIVTTKKSNLEKSIFILENGLKQKIKEREREKENAGNEIKSVSTFKNNKRRASMLGSPGKKRVSIVGVGGYSTTNSKNIEEIKVEEDHNDILIQMKSNEDKNKKGKEKNNRDDTKSSNANNATSASNK